MPSKMIIATKGIGFVVLAILWTIICIIWGGTIFSLPFLMMDMVAFNCAECAHIILEPTVDGNQFTQNLWSRFIGYEIVTAGVLLFWIGWTIWLVKAENK